MSNFYVHIIESPSPANLIDGISEGRLISEALRLAKIPCLYNLTVNKEMFLESINNRIGDATVEYQKTPFLHISAHGDKYGLELTDGSRINWNELKEIIKFLNIGLQSQFVICLSTCQGFSGCQMAMHVDKDIAFGAIVGPLGNIPWDESAIAFPSAAIEILFLPVALSLQNLDSEAFF
jgi:hypothetical protein